VEAGGGAEAVAEDVGVGCDSGLRLALVFGEFADEGKDLGNVVGNSRADSE
jgi:hypothetical protein